MARRFTDVFSNINKNCNFVMVGTLNTNYFLHDKGKQVLA